MSVKELRWLFVAVLSAVIVLGNMSNEPVRVGAWQPWTNGNYSFAGGTHPVALTLSLIFAVLYLLLMVAPPPHLGKPLPGVLRRFVTFWLDFLLAMIPIGPIVGILPALTEWKRTGTFQWHFERTFDTPADGWLVAAGFVLLLPETSFLLRIASDSSQTLTQAHGLLVTRSFLMMGQHRRCKWQY